MWLRNVKYYEVTIKYYSQDKKKKVSTKIDPTTIKTNFIAKSVYGRNIL